LLLGTPVLVLAKLPVPGAQVYLTIAWILLVLGLIGHWVAAYNYFWAILRKYGAGRRSAQGPGSTARPEGI
jgi:cardiolipin synthase